MNIFDQKLTAIPALRPYNYGDHYLSVETDTGHGSLRIRFGCRECNSWYQINISHQELLKYHVDESALVEMMQNSFIYNRMESCEQERKRQIISSVMDE